MKSIFNVLLALVFSLSFANAQWKQNYKYQYVDKAEMPEVVDLHTCFSKDNIYFTDRSSIYSLNIQYGKITNLATPPSNNDIDAFDIDSTGETLYYCTDKVLYKYSLAEGSIKDSNLVQSKSSKRRYLRISGNYLMFLSNTIKCFYVDTFGLNYETERNYYSISNDRSTLIYTSSYTVEHSDTPWFYYQQTYYSLTILDIANQTGPVINYGYSVYGTNHGRNFNGGDGFYMNRIAQYNQFQDEYIFSDISHLYISDFKVIERYWPQVSETMTPGRVDKFDLDENEGYLAFINSENSKIYFFDLTDKVLLDSIQLSGKLLDITSIKDDCTYIVESDSSVFRVSFASKGNDTDTISNNNSITVFPNPSYGELKLKFDLKESAEIIINVFDSMGNKVIVLFDGKLQKGISTETFDISALHPGIYFLQSTIYGKQYIRKIVKQ